MGCVSDKNKGATARPSSHTNLLGGLCFQGGTLVAVTVTRNSEGQLVLQNLANMAEQRTTPRGRHLDGVFELRPYSHA